MTPYEANMINCVISTLENEQLPRVHNVELALRMLKRIQVPGSPDEAGKYVNPAESENAVDFKTAVARINAIEGRYKAQIEQYEQYKKDREEFEEKQRKIELFLWKLHLTLLIGWRI